jgi:hypothetical protein
MTKAIENAIAVRRNNIPLNLIPRYKIPQLSLGDEYELKSREVALFKEPPAPAGGAPLKYMFE